MTRAAPPSRAARPETFASTIDCRTIMKKFTRQKSGNAPIADINLDFGAAAAKVARVFEPGEYRLRIESARVVQKGQNIFVALDLVNGGRR